MEKQYTVESLREEIKALELKQAEESKLVKEQLLIIYENFKPANILKNLVRDFYSSESLVKELMATAVSVASGFVSKRLVIGKSKNQFFRLVGLAVQLGITSLVSKKIEFLKEAALKFISRYTENKENTASDEEGDMR